MQFLYINIESTNKEYLPFFIEVFSPVINIVKYQIENNELVIYFDYAEEEILEVTESLVQDLYFNFNIFESIKYIDLCEAEKKYTLFKKIISKHPIKNLYNNSKTILFDYRNNIDDNMKQFILNEYYQNDEMKKTIITFLENNQNISLAAKELFLHRNTLTQRLDKFYRITSFDLKQFKDAYLIYTLINK